MISSNLSLLLFRKYLIEISFNNIVRLPYRYDHWIVTLSSSTFLAVRILDESVTPRLPIRGVDGINHIPDKGY